LPPHQKEIKALFQKYWDLLPDEQKKIYHQQRMRPRKSD
jgi:hypothetical protein